MFTFSVYFFVLLCLSFIIIIIYLLLLWLLALYRVWRDVVVSGCPFLTKKKKIPKLATTLCDELINNDMSLCLYLLNRVNFVLPNKMEKSPTTMAKRMEKRKSRREWESTIVRTKKKNIEWVKAQTQTLNRNTIFILWRRKGRESTAGYCALYACSIEHY